jgi:type I restriction enzyme S subunit
MKKGWESKALGELFDIGSSKRVLKSEWKTSGVPFYRGREITRLAVDGAVENELFISEEHFAELSKQYGVPTAGDIMITAIGTIGNTHIVRESDKFYFKDASVLWLKQNAKLCSDYVNHWFKSPIFYDQLDRGNGATVDTLTINKLRDMQIDLPPLAEQRRIVGVLDEAFAGLATAQANAQKNLQNARALFESHLQSVLSQRGDGWVETTLSKATGGIFTGPFGSLLHKSDYVEHGIPLVNPAHITEMGIEPDSRKTVSEETSLRLSNYIMRNGDIVIGRRGEMGRCALITDVEDGWLCGTGSFFIKPSCRCESAYLVRFLRSEGCKKRLEKIAGGAVMPNLSNTDLGKLRFHLPPIEKQKQIVTQLDALATETQRLETLYTRKLAALAELKKSLLHQAFSGEL